MVWLEQVWALLQQPDRPVDPDGTDPKGPHQVRLLHLALQIKSGTLKLVSQCGLPVQCMVSASVSLSAGDQMLKQK